MEITAEISYFPLLEEYQQPVEDFISALERNTRVKVEPGRMSSILTGSYEEIMNLLHQEMKPFIEKYPSIFTFKLSNSCPACKNS